jgi:hypothetical protein
MTLPNRDDYCQNLGIFCGNRPERRFTGAVTTEYTRLFMHSGAQVK